MSGLAVKRNVAENRPAPHPGPLPASPPQAGRGGSRPDGRGARFGSLPRRREDGAGRGYAAERVRTDGNELRSGLGGEGARDEDGLVERAT
jgi:hypothetical protein